MTKEEVLEEIKKNIRDCIETYSVNEDRYLESMKDEIAALVEEGFKKLGKRGDSEQFIEDNLAKVLEE